MFTQRRELKRFYFDENWLLWKQSVQTSEIILRSKTNFIDLQCSWRSWFFSWNIKCFHVTKSSLNRNFISSLNEATRREKDYLFTSMKPPRYFRSFQKDFSHRFEFCNFPRILLWSFSIDLRNPSKIEKISTTNNWQNSRHNQRSAYLNASFYSLHNGKSHLVVGRAQHGTQKPDCVWSIESWTAHDELNWSCWVDCLLM